MYRLLCQDFQDKNAFQQSHTWRFAGLSDPRHSGALCASDNDADLRRWILGFDSRINLGGDFISICGGVVGHGMQVRRGGEVHLVADHPVADAVPLLVICIVDPGNGLVGVSRAIAVGIRAVVQSDHRIEVIGDDEILHEEVEAGIGGRPPPEEATGVFAPRVRLPVIQVGGIAAEPTDYFHTGASEQGTLTGRVGGVKTD
jgi:hypothetical protein